MYNYVGGFDDEATDIYSQVHACYKQSQDNVADGAGEQKEAKKKNVTGEVAPLENVPLSNIVDVVALLANVDAPPEQSDQRSKEKSNTSRTESQPCLASTATWSTEELRQLEQTPMDQEIYVQAQ